VHAAKGAPSHAIALDVGGTFTDPDTGVIDGAATERLRTSKRGPVRMFHRGGYFGPLVEETRGASLVRGR